MAVSCRKRTKFTAIYHTPEVRVLPRRLNAGRARSPLPSVPEFRYLSSIMSTIFGDYQVLRNCRRDRCCPPPALAIRRRAERFRAVVVWFAIYILFSEYATLCGAERFEPTVSIASAEQAILLSNGAVILGRVADEGEMVRIAVDHGNMLVSKREIREVGGSLLELYLRQRDRLPPGEPEAHLELAIWCLEHGLEQQARQELQIAKSLCPSHPMIGFAERRLELSRAAGTDFRREPQKEKTPSVRDSAWNSARAANSLPLPSWMSDTTPSGSSAAHGKPNDSDAGQGSSRLSIRISDVPEGTAATIRRSDPSVLLRGLPPNAGPDFVRVIQPVLSNQCATAGCHGGNAPEERRLLRIPTGRTATRSETARNLQVVLGWIDFENPGASPLLAVPIRPHGGSSVPVISGVSARQYRELVDWVYSVTRKDGGEKAQVAPAEVNADMPGGIPPELQQPISPAFGGGAADGVVTASAISGPAAVQPAVAWEVENLPESHGKSAESHQNYFPEWFTENSGGEHSITLESEGILSTFPDNHGRLAPDGETASRIRRPLPPIAGIATPLADKFEASGIEAINAGTANVSADRARHQVPREGSARSETADPPRPKVLPFGDRLPQQNNLFYR